jgi:hypothetical protein
VIRFGLAVLCLAILVAGCLEGHESNEERPDDDATGTTTPAPVEAQPMTNEAVLDRFEAAIEGKLARDG